MDGLEREMGERLSVVRVNVHDAVGRQVGEAIGWEFTPTFVLFDPHGREIWRGVGGLNPAAVRAALGEN